MMRPRLLKFFKANFRGHDPATARVSERGEDFVLGVSEVSAGAVTLRFRGVVDGDEVAYAISGNESGFNLRVTAPFTLQLVASVDGSGFSFSGPRLDGLPELAMRMTDEYMRAALDCAKECGRDNVCWRECMQRKAGEIALGKARARRELEM